MPLIVTPGQLSQKASFYHQLASMTRAGVGLVQGLQYLARNPPAASWRGPIQAVLQQLESGSTFSESLGPLQERLPEFDRALIEAGEQSGRLDASFQLLRGYYEERARLARGVLSDLAYPSVVFLLALLIFPPGLLGQLVWQGEVAPFIWQKTMILGPILLAGLFVLYACQGQRGEFWRSGIERFVRRIPILGAARHELALARLCAALEGLLSAGVSIVPAWKLAGAASGSPALRRALRDWPAQISAGVPPSDLLQASSEFPELFSNLYTTGEASGQIDETLRRLYAHYQEEGSRKLHAFAQWTPRLIYFAILLLVGYQVVSFWVGYYSGILEEF
jgi:type II secretory pathway component PulF